MRSVGFLLSVLLLIPGVQAAAQAPAAADAAPKLTLVEQLDRFAAGRPIPLVVAAYGRMTGEKRAPADTAGKEWLPALQAVAESVSPPADAPPSPFYTLENCIPYRFGSAWTIAPDQQWMIRLDLAGKDIFTATTPEDLVAWLVRTMDVGQLEKAASSGVGWKDWSDDQQRILTALFRAPRPITNPERPGNNPGQAAPRTTPRGTDWLRKSALHLTVEFENVATQGANGTRSYMYWRSESLPSLTSDISTDTIPGTSLRYRQPGPAKLKPGDLNFAAAALNPPIGLRGVTTLKEAVAAAAATTHVALKLSPEFDAMPVFIGDASLRSGDVLKILTFGMQGAWRKIGNQWLLAWDKMGRGALSRWQTETTRPLERALNAAKDATEQKQWGILMLDHLPSDPDDPAAPTRAQIETLTGPFIPIGNGRFRSPTILIADLPPQQATALRARWTRPPWADKESGDDFQIATVEGVVVRATLTMPGIGEVRLGDKATSIYPETRANAAAAAAWKSASDWPPKDLPADNSLSLPQEVRAVAAPMLLRSEWPRLIEQMRRKGLHTLYVPVLWDGQTLFPSRYFPQPDALHGHDVLAEILADAAPAKIKVIGVLNTLAWRAPTGSAVHWLRKHPEWVDVDILGRARRDWATPEHLPSRPGDGSDWAEDPLLYADYVQPGNADVRAKLLGLAAELRHYPALDGTALAHWSRTAGRDYTGPAAPPLGFNMYERAASLAATGRDAVDIISNDYTLNRDQISFFPDPWDANSWGPNLSDAFAAAVYHADAALASDMIRALEPAWPGRVHLFSPLPDGNATGGVSFTARQSAARPPANIIISSTPTPGEPGQYRWLPAPMPLMAIPGPDAAGPDADRMARAAVRMRRLAAPPVEGQKPVAGVVLDFTTAPDLLWPCLRLLANRAGV